MSPDGELTDGLDESVAVTETEVLGDTDGLAVTLREFVGENETEVVDDVRVDAEGHVDVDGEPDEERDENGDLEVSTERVKTIEIEGEPVDDTVTLLERETKTVGESTGDADDKVDTVGDSEGLPVTVPHEVDDIDADSMVLAVAEIEARGESVLFDVLLPDTVEDAVSDAEPHTDDVSDDDGDEDGEPDV